MTASDCASEGSEQRYGEIIDRVFDIISSKLPAQEAAKHIDADVVLEMDRLRARGFEYWCLWVEYLRRFGKLPDLRFVRKQTTIRGDSVEVRGIACGTRGKRNVEEPIFVRFVFAGDKISEIYTTRFNYTAAFGPKIKHRLIFQALLLHMLAWAKCRRLQANWCF
ncbi:MAG: hypothetical protein ACRED0_08425 [Gammaproteobacteria bacterium]